MFNLIYNTPEKEALNGLLHKKIANMGDLLYTGDVLYKKYITQKIYKESIMTGKLYDQTVQLDHFIRNNLSSEHPNVK